MYKHGKQTPLYPYEQDIISKLSDPNTPYNIILKPVGCGVSSICLYFLVWMATRNSDWSQKSVGLIVGPNVSLAVKLMKRVRRMFEPYNIYWDTKETYSIIGQTEFESFPSHNLDSYRSLEAPICTFISEAEFFGGTYIRELAERYISKSGSQYKIIMESTAGASMSLFDQMFREPDSIYCKTRFDYTIPLSQGFYSQKEIDIALKSSSAQRELFVKFGGYFGSSFKPSDIQRAQEIEYEPDVIMPHVSRSLGIDEGYTGNTNGQGGGAFSFTVSEYTSGIIKVLYSQEFYNAEHSDMVSKAVELMNDYNCIKVWADAAGVDYIRSLKLEIGEDPEYHRVFERCKTAKIDPFNQMVVCPISFSTDHKQMMSHCKALMSDGLVAIAPKFTSLITSIASATDQDNSYQKHSGQCLFTDSFDSFRLCINPNMYQIGGSY